VFLYLDVYIGELDGPVLKEMVAVSRLIRIEFKTAVTAQTGTGPELTNVLEEIGLAGNDKHGGKEFPFRLLDAPERHEHKEYHD
jgi:hypothetical protein